MTALPYMRWYPSDYLADTTDLTRDEDGGYFLLLQACWLRGGKLPDDDRKLALITKCADQKEWLELRKILAPFFKISHGFWQQKRLSEELQKAKQIHDVRSKAGSKGVSKREANRKLSLNKREARARVPEPYTNPESSVAPSHARARGNGTIADLAGKHHGNGIAGIEDKKIAVGVLADIDAKQPLPDTPQRSSGFQQVGTRRRKPHEPSQAKSALMAKIARWLPPDAVGEFWNNMMGPDAQAVLDKTAAAMNASGWVDNG
jgi:uncharacterized protein YdaU (DUF1376 family)